MVRGKWLTLFDPLRVNNSDVLGRVDDSVGGPMLAGRRALVAKDVSSVPPHVDIDLL